jgi:hypothetical protein
MSVTQLPPTPNTSLRIGSLDITSPESLPVVAGVSRRGDTATIEEEYTVVDGKGGEQTAFYGVLHHGGEVIAEFELRTGSNLVAVWSFTHTDGAANYLRVKWLLDCVEHYSNGGTRGEIWATANQYGTGDVHVRGWGAETFSVGEEDMHDIDQTKYSLDVATLQVPGIAGDIAWYTPTKFEFSDDSVSGLADCYPVVEAFEGKVDLPLQFMQFLYGTLSARRGLV